MLCICILYAEVYVLYIHSIWYGYGEYMLGIALQGGKICGVGRFILLGRGIVVFLQR